jgi:hypothetical protein
MSWRPPSVSRWGGSVSAQDMVASAQGAGFTGQGLITAVAVSLAEDPSSDPGAHCLNCAGVAEDSQGYWQINVLAHPQYAGGSMYNGAANAAAAFAISNGGSNFGAWSTYTNGAYLGNLATAQSLVGGGSSAPPSSYPPGGSTVPNLPAIFAGSVTVGATQVPTWALWGTVAVFALLVLD